MRSELGPDLAQLLDTLLGMRDTNKFHTATAAALKNFSSHLPSGLCELSTLQERVDGDGDGGAGARWVALTRFA